MNLFGRMIGIFGMVFSCLVLAEKGFKTIESVDKDFFQKIDKNEKKNQEEYTQSPRSGTKRKIVSGEPSFSTEQQRQFNQSCGVAKTRSPRAFRECVRGQREKASNELKQKEIRVEESQASPLKNIPEEALKLPAGMREE